MGWLSRLAGSTSRAPGGPEESEDPAPQPTERPCPGISALFGGVAEGGDHAVLDLGPAADSSLQVYGRYARRIRFADLLTTRSKEGISSALAAIPDQEDRPYDLLFVWDVLDRLFPRERSRVMERLVEVSAPDARLHAIFRASDADRAPPLRFSLKDVDRMQCEPTAPPRPTRRRLLPSDVEELLSPFRVMKGFTLRDEMREYFAVRGERARF